VKTYLETSEVEQLEQAAEYLRDKLLIRLLFHLGCRVSEALGIKVENVDFKQGTVTIEHLKARIKLSCPECSARLGKMHKFCPVCGIKVAKAVAEEKEHHRYRSLPVDKNTLTMLKEYIARGGVVLMANSQRLCREGGFAEAGQCGKR
jgi:integrase/recombinase XerD